uniref:Uncharacterized protein n=1 Tax=Plectus sambesii TaxID=2011161 RepID=A0A914WHJ9_9BILA
SLTQDLREDSKTYEVLGTDKMVVLRCRPALAPISGEGNAGIDLYILTGHESTL